MQGMAAERLKEFVRPYYLKWLYFPLKPHARPDHWRQTWCSPWVPLTQSPRLEGALTAGAVDFLFLPMNDWHARVQRPQHLARALVRRGARVFYLNPNLGREYPGPAAFARPRLARLEPGIFELHVPLPREPVFHHRLLAATETDAVARACRELISRCAIRRLALIVSFPLWSDLAVLLRREFHAPLLYDCHDLVAGFRRIAPDLVAAEASLVEAADTVLFTAESLRDETLRRHPRIAARSLVVRNGVDEAHFRPARRPRGATQSPLAGYVGALDEWFDVEAIQHAAARLPHLRFRLIGRIEDPGVRVLAALPNVELAGEIPYADLPRHLLDFDVALIPFRRTPLTLATNPIKLYEYFACGLPVVSTRLPEVERYSGLVHLAGSPEEFTAALEQAAAGESTAAPARRIQVAERESWSERAGRIWSLVLPQ
jgi:glycosyltransferase involved in cell wall biosynthesis